MSLEVFSLSNSLCKMGRTIPTTLISAAEPRRAELEVVPCADDVSADLIRRVVRNRLEVAFQDFQYTRPRVLPGSRSGKRTFIIRKIERMRIKPDTPLHGTSNVSGGPHKLRLYDSRAVAGSARSKLLVAPIAFIAETATGFYLPRGSAFTSLISHDAAVGSLARWFGGAIVWSDAISKTSVGSVRKWLVSVLAHVLSVRGAWQEWQSGIPLMEVSSGA